MTKTLLEKISDVIDKHIDDKILKNKVSEKQALHEYIKKEINKMIVESKYMFVDIFGNQCILSDITEDHVLPQKENGSNNESNIIRVCRISNQNKGSDLKGNINHVEWKIHDKTSFKDGKEKGVLSIKKPDSNRWKNVSTKKEKTRFEDYKRQISAENWI